MDNYWVLKSVLEQAITPQPDDKRPITCSELSDIIVELNRPVDLDIDTACILCMVCKEWKTIIYSIRPDIDQKTRISMLYIAGRYGGVWFLKDYMNTFNIFTPSCIYPIIIAAGIASGNNDEAIEYAYESGLLNNIKSTQYESGITGRALRYGSYNVFRYYNRLGWKWPAPGDVIDAMRQADDGGRNIVSCLKRIGYFMADTYESYIRVQQPADATPKKDIDDGNRLQRNVYESVLTVVRLIPYNASDSSDSDDD